ncbi:hypothetical protein ACQU0X_25920 [Pseudovibrio ascidiaceicola]|uniref:hypothetical protein n=1 Tax=Pseudovibrio ascidiaceicola TaxID=285279 RepID=UPI003D35B9D6
MSGGDLKAVKDELAKVKLELKKYKVSYEDLDITFGELFSKSKATEAALKAKEDENAELRLALADKIIALDRLKQSQSTCP